MSFDSKTVKQYQDETNDLTVAGYMDNLNNRTDLGIKEVQEDVDTKFNEIINYIVEEDSNEYGSWKKYKNGDIEMWGSGNFPAGTEPDKRSKITLPTECIFNIDRDIIHVQARNYSPSIPSYDVFEPTNTYFLVMGKHLTSQAWVESKAIYWSLKSRWK